MASARQLLCSDLVAKFRPSVGELAWQPASYMVSVLPLPDCLSPTHLATNLAAAAAVVAVGRIRAQIMTYVSECTVSKPEQRQEGRKYFDLQPFLFFCCFLFRVCARLLAPKRVEPDAPAQV